MNNLSSFEVAHEPLSPMLKHEIRIRAYELYGERGQHDGHALEHWLEAEAEVLARCKSANALIERKLWLAVS
jgi:Protein of unknown function (DUF2934)